MPGKKISRRMFLKRMTAYVFAACGMALAGRGVPGRKGAGTVSYPARHYRKLAG